MSSFAIYLTGVAVLIAGLIILGTYLKLAAIWLVIGSIVILGIGIISGVSRTRRRDSSQA